METPNLKKQLRGKPKKEPLADELRELRGFAVEIKSPVKPRDIVKNIADIIDGDESSSHVLPSLSGHGGTHQTFGAMTKYQ